MACAKIKRTKYVHNINNNAVQGRLSENYITRKIIAWNILDTKYSRFTVYVKIVTHVGYGTLMDRGNGHCIKFLIIILHHYYVLKQEMVDNIKNNH